MERGWLAMPSDLDISAIPLAKIPALIAALAARLLIEPEESTAALAAPISTPSDTDRMLTVKEVAERLRCSAKTIYRRVEADGFPSPGATVGGRGFSPSKD